METSTDATVDCEIIDCTGIAVDHDGANVTEHLHSQPGRLWPLPSTPVWPMDIFLVIDHHSFPFWKLDVELGTLGNLDPESALYIAAEIQMNALYVSELNAAITHQDEAPTTPVHDLNAEVN